MIPDLRHIRRHVRFAAAITCAVFLTGCATQPIGRPQDLAAVKSLRAARSQQLSLETRAADYLEAAALTAPELGSGTQPILALSTYNSATAELTILLRSAQGGRLWNHPLTLTASSTSYNWRLQPTRNPVW